MNSGMGILPGEGHQVQNAIRMMRKHEVWS